MIRQILARLDALEAAVEALRPRAGKGMVINRKPSGTTYTSTAVAAKKGKAAPSQPSISPRWG